MMYTPYTHMVRRTLGPLLVAGCAALCVLMGVAAVRGDEVMPAVRFVDDVKGDQAGVVLVAVQASEHRAEGVEVDRPVRREMLHATVASGKPAVEVSYARVLWMEVTAYCPCTKCCGANAQGVTASGKPVTYDAGRFVAADTELLPFGTRVQIPGYHEGGSVEVIDRGGAIKGHKIDVFFPSHDEALQWGRRWVAVTVGE